MDQMRDALRSRHYSRRTEQAYCLWVRRYLRFHHMRHPRDMGEREINKGGLGVKSPLDGL
jgi:Phage integrase, N-terminal SAM-like domain